MKRPSGHEPRSSSAFDLAQHSAQTSRRSAPGLAADFARADFNALFESSAEALLIIDVSGAIQNANRRGSQLLRLKNVARAHRQSSLNDFLLEANPAQLKKFYVQRPHSDNFKNLNTTLASGLPIRITLRSILPGSKHLLLCLEERPVVQSAEAKWRQAEAELRSLLDSISAGAILIDLSGRMRFVNLRFGQFFGLNSSDLRKIVDAEELGRIVSSRFRDPQAFSAPWKLFAGGKGDPAQDELEIVRPTRRVIERFSRPVLDPDGRATGWLELYSDVTGDRQIQSKMLQTEKMAALGQLVSGIAHELNNPLTAIMGYAQLMLGHGLSEAQLSEAERVYQEAERARRIVKNLLYFARENKPERTRVDLNEIVERTLGLRSYELKVENIVVACELAPDLPRTMADPYQLQQVVLNLLLNAEHALLEQRGEGNVRIRTSRTTRFREDRIVLECSDDGPGIPGHIASRIFDPFFTTKPPGTGTGLGLSIVYGIVHQHGGEVTFESHPGCGTKFLVDLPVIAIPADQRMETMQPAFSGQAETIPRGRILVVEDEASVAQLIADILNEEGHQAEATLDSQDGLMRLSRNRYDLVICDLRMPGLDGPAFYDALVRSGSPMQNRILFVTGDVMSPRTIQFLEPSGLPYLAKPFLVEELKLAVNHMLALSLPRDSLGGKTEADAQDAIP